VTIRLATEADLGAINAIYNHYVLHGTATFQLAPETEAARLAWFRAHDAEHPVTVAEMDGVVVGWGALNRYKEREAYVHTVENSIYVAPGHQRRGIGAALLADQIARARALGHHTLIAGISADGQASIALHERFGFVKAGHIREVGRLSGRWLDAVIYQLML
jgi:phosphinothricin acetyltransferase